MYAIFAVAPQLLRSFAGVEGKDALHLLDVHCRLHYGGVPMQLFEAAWKGAQRVRETSEKGRYKIRTPSQWHILQLPDFLQAGLDEWDAFRFQEAVNLLISLALVTRSKQNSLHTLSMHLLAQAWVKDRQNRTQKGKAWTTTGSVIALSFYRH